MADEESHPAKRRKLRLEQIQACRSATQTDPEDAEAWNYLCHSLLKAEAEIGNGELVNEAIESAKKAASLGASRYNLACALAVGGRIDEALTELEDCLERDEIEPSHLWSDPDWKALREDSRFQDLLSRYL